MNEIQKMPKSDPIAEQLKASIQKNIIEIKMFTSVGP